MNQLQFIVPDEQNGCTLGSFLRSQGFSTGMIRRLKQTDGIRLDGVSVTVRHTLQAGQILIVQLPVGDSDITPVSMDLDIVYEDDWLLVVNKPSGMPVHPSQGHREDTLANGVAYYFQNTPFSFHPITRLDRYTAGLTLIAKNPVAAADLCRQAKEGTIQKTYFALTDGIPNPKKGTIDLPIGRVEGSVIARCVRPDGKPSRTHYETVSAKNGRAWVQVQPVTGRTHQIRVHMAAVGCPLLYDFLYGKEREGKVFSLICSQLVFTHPQTKEQKSIKISSKSLDFD